MKIPRYDAIKTIMQMCKEDDYWMDLVERFYDEELNDWPTVEDALMALGANEQELEQIKSEI